MPKTYKISAENVVEIKEVRKTITTDRCLRAIQFRGKGLTNDEITPKLDTSAKMVSQFVSAY